MRNLAKYIQKPFLCVAAIAVAGLCNCAKTPLVAPSSADAVFVIEWPSAKTTDLPKTGAIYLYPSTGESPIIVPNIDGRSSAINLQEGSYDVIVHNENFNSIQLRNQESYTDFEAYLPIKPFLTYSKTIDPVNSVVDQADYFYLLPGGSFRKIEIVKGESKTFTLSPQPATQSFRFEVQINTNIAFKEVKGLLTGVASRLNIRSTKAIATDISAIEIPFAINTTRSHILTVNGVVETFGVDPENRLPGSNTLVLDLIPEVPDPSITTHFKSDLTTDFDQHNSINLDVKVTIDPSEDPSKPGELQISVVVKPWIEQDGGNIDINPSLAQQLKAKRN